MKPASACATANRAPGRWPTSSFTAVHGTPPKVVSNRLHRVTQWMSCVTSTFGSLFSSAHVRVRSESTWPHTLKSQPVRSVGYSAMAPACSTGHFSVRYWPGGRRDGSYPASSTFRSALDLNMLPTLDGVTVVALRAARLPRGYVGVRGPEAASYLQRMLSNDVEALAAAESCEALLLTPKARVIARLTVWRRAAEDFLLLTEPGLDERVRAELQRMRFAAKCDIALERHASTLFIGGSMPEHAIPNADYGVPAWEELDGTAPNGALAVDEEELELLRIRACTPRAGRELDDRVLPAEAGLDERAISFTKGCYPGQEPVARLHYRGHANRGLRALAVEGDEPLPYDAEVTLDGKVVGRVTSVVSDRQGGLAALAFVRREVPDDAPLDVLGRSARPLD